MLVPRLQNFYNKIRIVNHNTEIGGCSRKVEKKTEIILNLT